MAFDKHQFRRLVTDVLRDVSMYSASACELLLMTAAVESQFGTYLYQLGNGPAQGVFQIEPKTHQWLVEKYRIDDLGDNLEGLGSADMSFDLIANIPYQIFVARLKYYSIPKALPTVEKVDGFLTDKSIEDLAKYWKKYYNTELGKGTVEEAINAYKKYCM